jgi:hypothetical protein
MCILPRRTSRAHRAHLCSAHHQPRGKASRGRLNAAGRTGMALGRTGMALGRSAQPATTRSVGCERVLSSAWHGAGPHWHGAGPHWHGAGPHWHGAGPLCAAGHHTVGRLRTRAVVGLAGMRLGCACSVACDDSGHRTSSCARPQLVRIRIRWYAWERRSDRRASDSPIRSGLKR